MRTLLASSAVAALTIAGLVTGCSHPPASQVAGVSGGTSASAAGPLSARQADQDFIDYAKCMRASGVSDYPDPVQRAGHSGLSLQYAGDASSPAFIHGDDQCKHYIAPIADLKAAGNKDQVSPQKLRGLIAYSRCMRQHQVPALDPDPNDGHISLGSVPGLPDVGRASPEFSAADTVCRSLLPDGTLDDGTGPP